MPVKRRGSDVTTQPTVSLPRSVFDDYGKRGQRAVDPLPHEGKKLNNLVVRTLTIAILGPLLFLCAMQSKESCTLLIFVGVFVAGIEWSGLKRHLKVALLLWGGTGGNLHETHLHKRSAQRPGRGLHGGASPSQASPLGDGLIRDTDSGGERTMGTVTPLLTPLLPSSPLLSNGQPLRPEEYSVPIVPVSLYQILKHIGWAGLALAAYVSVNAFAVTLSAFFLIFVCVTVMAHNQLEMKVEKATSILSHLDPDEEESGGRGEGGRGEGEGEGEAGRRPERTTARLVERAVKKAQRAYFLSLELQMIAEKQPTEQFLDFCLDIFGILWVSGLVYPIFFYSTPRVGLPWGFATLLGNFCNDIMALVVGRSLKAIRQRYSAEYDLPCLPQQPQSCATAKYSDDGREEREGAKKKRRPLSEAGPFLRLVLKAPHALYPAISPNKSVEGAVAGVLTNALVFAASMSICYSHVTPLPDPSIIAHGFHRFPVWLLIGLAMGVLGVVGDLLQSLLKRTARVKDAGFIVPGHGGILDRLDGCLLVFPFMFCVMSGLSALSH